LASVAMQPSTKRLYLNVRRPAIKRKAMCVCVYSILT
jgi:hypothetical protein